MQLNIEKLFFAKQEVDYLGYVINQSGISPQGSKVEVIAGMVKPKTVTQLRRFAGMINFYRDLWPKRAHNLAPLTALIDKKKGALNWNTEAEQAFENIKTMIQQDALLHYPDFNKPFDIHTDSSEYQMGAVISQNGRPIAYWLKKLSDTQKNYPTTDQELLAIVECLKK